MKIAPTFWMESATQKPTDNPAYFDKSKIGFCFIVTRNACDK